MVLFHNLQVVNTSVVHIQSIFSPNIMFLQVQMRKCRYWKYFRWNFRNGNRFTSSFYKLIVFQKFVMSIIYCTIKCDIVLCWPVLSIAVGRAPCEYSKYVDSSSTCFLIHNSDITQCRIENEIVWVGINRLRKNVKVWFQRMQMTSETNR